MPSRRRGSAAARPPTGVRDGAPASCGSMIPLASSPRSDTADWMAKAVVTMAIMDVSMDSSASMPGPPEQGGDRPAGVVHQLGHRLDDGAEHQGAEQRSSASSR